MRLSKKAKSIDFTGDLGIVDRVEVILFVFDNLFYIYGYFINSLQMKDQNSIILSTSYCTNFTQFTQHIVDNQLFVC